MPINVLPVKQENDPFRTYPKILVIVSKTGEGKTTLAQGLPNCLIIDYEGGEDVIDKSKLKGNCLVINVKKEAETSGRSALQITFDILKGLKEANAEAKGFIYDFIFIDSITAMEEIARDLGTHRYKTGFTYKGIIKEDPSKKITDTVLELEWGAGYMWWYKSFKELFKEFTSRAGKAVIFTGHITQSSLIKSGENVDARDLELSKKNKIYTLREASAVCFLYRTDTNLNEVVMSFKSSEKDLIVKARSLGHLNQREFVISRLDPEKNEIEFFWEEVYPKWIKK